ncbi:MAG: hypothetical protein K0Q60_3086, partial [Microvirga sp.]|nr:hypothetical protein [Microvirga sp.]
RSLRPALIRPIRMGQALRYRPWLPVASGRCPPGCLPCARGGGGATKDVNSATEVTPSRVNMNRRKRRRSVSSPRHDTAVTELNDIALVAPCLAEKIRRVTYQSLRKGNLSIVQKAFIRANAGNQSPRTLATNFGLSHESTSSFFDTRAACRAQVEIADLAARQR